MRGSLNHFHKEEVSSWLRAQAFRKEPPARARWWAGGVSPLLEPPEPSAADWTLPFHGHALSSGAHSATPALLPFCCDCPFLGTDVFLSYFLIFKIFRLHFKADGILVPGTETEPSPWQ